MQLQLMIMEIIQSSYMALKLLLEQLTLSTTLNLHKQLTSH